VEYHNGGCEVRQGHILGLITTVSRAFADFGRVITAFLIPTSKGVGIFVNTGVIIVSEDPRENIVPQVGAFMPYPIPIYPPLMGAGVDDEPKVALCINSQWMNYVLGCAGTLARYETWQTDRDSAANLVIEAMDIQNHVLDSCTTGLDPTNWYGGIEIIQGHGEYNIAFMLPEDRCHLALARVNRIGDSPVIVKVYGEDIPHTVRVGGHMQLRWQDSQLVARVGTLYHKDCLDNEYTDSLFVFQYSTGEVEQKEYVITFDGDINIEFVCYGSYTCGPV